MIKLGLIGYPLGHSFSKSFYNNKFQAENITGYNYELYPVQDMHSFESLYLSDKSFKGFNVTIPHKIAVIPLLKELSEEAQTIGAVNCITIKQTESGPELKGYNTDAYGFENSIKPLLNDNHQKALVLGNGGAAKAVYYTLRKLNIPFLIVSRSKENGDLTYQDLTEEIIQEYTVIINCSPVGTFPNVDQSPEIPYQHITESHLLYDLIYNPEETLFLKKGKEKGATIKNGYEMLVLQAEKNWEIWQNTI